MQRSSQHLPVLVQVDQWNLSDKYVAWDAAAEMPSWQRVLRPFVVANLGEDFAARFDKFLRIEPDWALYSAIFQVCHLFLL